MLNYTNTSTCKALISQETYLQSKISLQQCEIKSSMNATLSDTACSASEGEYSLLLHLVAIFVLFIASFIGTVIPIAGKYVSVLRMHPFAVVIGKCVSSGVVMSVATVHMINHSVLGFMKDCVPPSLRDSYDAFALLFALIAVVLMHALDVVMNMFLERWAARDANRDLPDGSTKANEGNQEGAAPSNDVAMGCHNHGTLASMRLTSARRIASVIFMEFGLALHSVFLGLSVGISNDAEMRALLVALTFHQIFEGLALGSRLADASMHAAQELAMTLIYSFSVPVGTAIGVGTLKGANISMTGSVFVGVQAIFDGVCGGMLLYLGFTLLVNDFPADVRSVACVGSAHRGWRVLAMLAALWVGAVIMTVLGRWA